MSFRQVSRIYVMGPAAWQQVYQYGAAMWQDHDFNPFCPWELRVEQGIVNSFGWESCPGGRGFQICLAKMTTSRRVADRKINKFQKNIFKRGLVPDTATQKKKTSHPVGPFVLGLFVFVVIGSALLQVIRTASSGGV